MQFFVFFEECMAGKISTLKSLIRSGVVYLIYFRISFILHNNNAKKL